MRRERLGDEKRLHLVIGVKQRLEEDWMAEKLVLNDLTTLRSAVAAGMGWSGALGSVEKF